MVRSYGVKTSELDSVILAKGNKKKRTNVKASKCHHIALPHSIQETPSGRKLAKCEKCGSGFDLTTIEEQKRLEEAKRGNEDIDDIFRKVRIQPKNRRSYPPRKYGNRPHKRTTRR